MNLAESTSIPTQTTPTLTPRVVRVELHSLAPQRQLPKRQPRFLPTDGVPGLGHEVYLMDNSAWLVRRIAHEFVGRGEVAVHVLVEPVGEDQPANGNEPHLTQ